jgi:hypothetical protein
MHRTTLILTSVALAIGAAQDSGSRVVRMQELTVPAARLFPGCGLSPASPDQTGNSVRPRNWAGLNIPTNPWAGTDKPLTATIRQRISGAPLTPDGPPLTARESASYRLHLAEGVDEAYVAIYSQPETADHNDVIVVYALRFLSSTMPDDIARVLRQSDNPRIIRVSLGQVVVVVHGDGGPCFQAVEAHVKALAR